MAMASSTLPGSPSNLATRANICGSSQSINTSNPTPVGLTGRLAADSFEPHGDARGGGSDMRRWMLVMAIVAAAAGAAATAADARAPGTVPPVRVAAVGDI